MKVIGSSSLLPPLRSIAVGGLLWLAAIAHPGRRAAQNTMAATPGSSWREDSDEMPLSSHQSLPLQDPVAMIRQRDYPRAEKNLSEYLLIHPDAAEAHFLLGYTLYREDKARASLAEYTTGARFHKPEANDLAVVAMDYILLHDYAGADRWLRQAVAWSPENSLYRYYLGRTQYAENRFQEAIESFNKCLALQPRNVKAEYNLGLAWEGLDHNADAVQAYRTAIAWQQTLAKQDPQPYLDLGILQLHQGQVTEAEGSLQTAASLDKQNPKIHEELGEAYEQLKKLAQAQAELETAASLAPNVPSLHFELGRIYQREGLRGKAQEQFARCAALSASHSTDSAETPNPEVPR